MADLNITGVGLGGGLQELLNFDEIQPDDILSYQAAKSCYLYHPLGGKMAESPIRLAQSQDRDIVVPVAEEEIVVERFRETWKAQNASTILLNLKTLARVYGLASVIVGEREADVSKPIDLAKIWNKDVYFNVLDPLNTAGLIVDQNPNSPTFQKVGDIQVGGVRYHRSRSITVLNEQSIYIAWTGSSFAYAGRSTYQRAWYPLRSFLNTMIVDDMVARKAGLIVAKMEQPGSVVDRIMGAMAAVKRNFLRLGRTNEVLGISTTETIESLNMTNIDGALQAARNDIIKNIATAADMPAKLLTQESYVEGFGEGTEDAKAVASFIDRLRIEMQPEYAWMDTIIQRLAWTPEWFETVKAKYPKDFAKETFESSFYRWRNAFRATWPSLIQEEPSELVTIDDVRLKAAIATVQVLSPILAGAPEELTKLVDWLTGVINTNENLFSGDKLEFDMDALLDAFEETKDSAVEAAKLAKEENSGAGRPFSGKDSVESVQRWLSDGRTIGERIAAVGGRRRG